MLQLSYINLQANGIALIPQVGVVPFLNFFLGRFLVMKKLLIAAAGMMAVGLSAPASAADLAARPYTKAPPPVVAPISDWTGFYIGANGGLGQKHSFVGFLKGPWTVAGGGGGGSGGGVGGENGECG